MHRSANFHLFLLGESGRSSSYGSSTSLPVPTFANDTITYFSPALVSFHYTVLAFFPAVFMCVYYFRMTSHRNLIKFLTFIIKEVRLTQHKLLQEDEGAGAAISTGMMASALQETSSQSLNKTPPLQVSLTICTLLPRVMLQNYPHPPFPSGPPVAHLPPPPLFAGLIFLHHILTENDVPLLLYLSTVQKDYPYMLPGIGYLRKYLPYLPLISKHVDMWIGREGCVVFKSVRVFFCVSCLFGWLRNALCCGQQD